MGRQTVFNIGIIGFGLSSFEFAFGVLLGIGVFSLSETLKNNGELVESVTVFIIIMITVLSSMIANYLLAVSTLNDYMWSKKMKIMNFWILVAGFHIIMSIAHLIKFSKTHTDFYVPTFTLIFHAFAAYETIQYKFLVKTEILNATTVDSSITELPTESSSNV